jgi:hypothetical protein
MAEEVTTEVVDGDANVALFKKSSQFRNLPI